MQLEEEKCIIVEDPKPYQKVSGSFMIYGAISPSLFKKDSNFNFSLSIEVLEVNGKTISASSVQFYPPKNTHDLNQFIKFKFIFDFQNLMGGLSNGWITSSQGRMTIRLSLMDTSVQNIQNEIFLPIILDIQEPVGGYDLEIIKKHETIEQRVGQYRQDYKSYQEELGEMFKRRQELYNMSLTDVVGEFIEVNEDLAEEVFFIIESEHDSEKRLLDEKYKDAITCYGPMLRGLVGRQNGYDFRVYSNDHGRHFHVIHKERGINARFSFPEINLINYKKSKNIINTKTKEKIRDFFRIQSNFNRLEAEFLKKPEQ
jgi:hypothetical protein